ncbi:MAG: sulfite exporter TauE/SafE family protein [Methanomethylovorans sp.]|uniref:sulfite exporter TauE/SafE family protein n=1 Tax=Methanomethylovorans sp. TaxID=2758717 RepID=UPI0035307E6B
MGESVKNIWSFISGTVIGILGGLMGLGGAEFRLPVLVGFFRFTTFQGIIINLVVSLVTVSFSLIFRSASIPLSSVADNYGIILNLLAGSIIGAFMGVRLATRINPEKLDDIVFVFLTLLGIFMISHSLIHFSYLELAPIVRIMAGFLAGIVIGIFSSMLGVAGGELIIPTIILLYSIDIKLAGSLSLCISFPTLLIGIMKYRKNEKFMVIKDNINFVIFMAIGSVVGAFIGSRMLIGVGAGTLQVILGTILLVSAIKIFRKRSKSQVH